MEEDHHRFQIVIPLFRNMNYNEFPIDEIYNKVSYIATTIGYILKSVENGRDIKYPKQGTFYNA